MPSGVEMRLVNDFGNAIADNCPVQGATRQEYFLSGSAPFATCYVNQYPYDTLGFAVDTLPTFNDRVVGTHEEAVVWRRYHTGNHAAAGYHGRPGDSRHVAGQAVAAIALGYVPQARDRYDPKADSGHDWAETGSTRPRPDTTRPPPQGHARQELTRAPSRATLRPRGSIGRGHVEGE